MAHSSNLDDVIWDEVSCNLLGKQSKFAALDFETTGLDTANARVWQVGLAIFRGGELVDSIDSILNPQIPPSDFEWDNGHLPTPDALSQAPLFSEIAERMTEITEDHVIVGHRLSFDAEFWRNECLRAGVQPPKRAGMCSKVLAYAAGHKAPLFDIARRFRIGVNGQQAHTAYDDALVTARLAVRLVRVLGGQDEASRLHHDFVASDISVINYNSTPAQNQIYYRAHGIKLDN